MKKVKTKLIALALLAALLLPALVGCLGTKEGNTLFRNSMVACSYGTHYGYSDRVWANVISPVYDYAYNFNEFNVARVKQDGKYGLINTRGIYVAEPLYDYIGAFSENGLAPFVVDGKLGYLTSNGQVIIEARFDTEKGFFNFDPNGLCVFYEDGYYGLINEFGQIVLDPKYDSINTSLWSMNLCGVEREGKFALYTATALSVTGYVYDSVAYGGKDTVIVGLNGLFYYLRSDGTLLFENGFEKAWPFSANDLALVWEDGLYGYINPDGRYELEERFTDARSFAPNGLALVQDGNGKYGYINRFGDYVIQPKYLSGSDFVSDTPHSLNLAVVETPKGFGVINASGRMIVRPTYTSLSIRVYDDDFFAGITPTGTVIFKRSGKVVKVFGQGEINLEK